MPPDPPRSLFLRRLFKKIGQYLILHLHLNVVYYYLFTYPMSSWIDAARKKTNEFNGTANSNLPIRITVAHYSEEILFYVQSFQK